MQDDDSDSTPLTPRQLWTARLLSVVLFGVLGWLIKDGLVSYIYSSRTLCREWIELGHTLIVTEHTSFLSRHYRASECKWGIEVSGTREYSDDDYGADGATITEQSAVGYEVKLDSSPRWRWKNGSWWRRHGDEWIKE